MGWILIGREKDNFIRTYAKVEIKKSTILILIIYMDLNDYHVN